MKRELFEEESDGEETLRVNQEFAEKFERRERRKELERLNQEIQENEEQSSGQSSSDYSQDSEGALINEKVEEKFMQAMVDIRQGNMKKEEAYFSDDDFNIDDQGLIKTRENKRKTYKDLMREKAQGKSAAEDEEEDSELDFELKKKMLETPNQEQARIKKEFLDAADSESQQEEDGFLVKLEKEDGAERDLGLIEKEDIKLDEFMKQNKQVSAPKEYDLLEKFWGDDAQLNANDKFLRNYILAQGWKGGSTSKMQEVDLEDELREEEMEDYEERYNFRFEEKQGANIITHARNTEDTLRIKDTSRKTKRDAVSKRKAEEKRKKMEQLQRIRELKKQEVLDKIKQVEREAGEKLNNEKRELLEAQLETQFDPEAYDMTMNDTFVEEVKEESKSEEEDQREVEEREVEEDQGAELEQEAMENVAQKGIWYVCDSCLRAIKPGKPRYELEKAEEEENDFTLCGSCYKYQQGVRKFKKLMIPKICRPPPDADAIISRQFVACVECKKQLADKKLKGLWCEEQQAFYCSKCSKTKENLSFRKITQQELLQLEGEKPAADMKKDIVQEYDELEYEDIIGNDLPTRFKYEKVAEESYGLQDEELLYLQDKSLNSLLSLKKLAPYREGGRIDLRKIQFQKKKLQGELKQKKREIKNMRKEREKAMKGAKKAGIKFEDFVEEEKTEKREEKKEKKKIKESRRVAYGA